MDDLTDAQVKTLSNMLAEAIYYRVDSYNGTPDGDGDRDADEALLVDYVALAEKLLPNAETWDASTYLTGAISDARCILDDPEAEPASATLPGYVDE